MSQHIPWGEQNGTLDLPMLLMSRGYGTLVDQTTPLDHALLLI